MNKKVDLLNGPIDSSLRKFTLPLAFSFLIHMLYSWVDTYYVSRLGTEAIAAIGVSEILIFITFTIGSGFGIGTGIVVARRIGEGDQKEADSTATQAVIVMLIFSTVLALILSFLVKPALHLMQFSGRSGELAEIYLKAYLLGLPGTFLIFQINAIVRSSGNSVFPMIILITTSVLNAGISPLLVFGIGPFPRLEIQGAGIATALSNISGAVISLYAVKRNYTPVNFAFKGFRFNPQIILRILRIGFPASLQLMTVSINRVALITLTKTFGTTVVAAYTLGLKLDLFVLMPIFASGTAVEITTGQNLGAKNLERVFAYYRSAIKQLAILMSLLGLMVFFFGEYFVMIFTNDKEILDTAGIYLKIVAFAYLPFSVGSISLRTINGGGGTFRSLFIIVTMLLIIQLPLAYLLSVHTSLDEAGIWTAALISQLFYAITGYYQIKKQKWIKKNV